MRFAALPPPTLDELKQAYHRTELVRLGYSFETAMESAMFSKVLRDLVFATRMKPKTQRQPAPIQQALI